MDVGEFAGQVIDVESQAVARMRGALDDHFERAVRMIVECGGAVIVTGVGKAGHIGRKLSATLASTGTPSHFLNAADAVHGDVGSVRPGDVLLILSASGESDEVVRLLSIARKLGHPVIAITATRTSSLGRHADVTIAMGRIEEACPLRLAPSASTTAMLALGDALALTVMRQRSFSADDFALFHPAGQLGRKLIRVSEAMTFKLDANLPVTRDTHTVGEVLAIVSKIKRRSGAVILVGEAGKLSGFFSDGDLRRHIVRDPQNALSTPIATVMTRDPKRIRGDALASEALGLMKHHRIDELPVVDEEDRPIGLIDIQDLIVLKMFDVDQGQ